MHTARAIFLASVIALLAFLDYWSGPDFGFSLFYLMPVGVAAWRMTERVAVMAAVLSGFAWLAADVPYHGLTTMSVWNAFTRLCMYVALALLTARVRRNRDDMTSMNRQLEALLRQEQELARTDALTRLPNARMFKDALRRAIARQRRDGAPLAVGYLDLDNFKRVNDTRGHGAGDAALRTVAAALTAIMRAGDIAARIGGDEFAVLFHDCDEAAARAAGIRLLDGFDRTLTSLACAGLGITGGIACFNEAPDDPEEMIAAADRALYEGKAAGKGRLIVVPAPATGQSGRSRAADRAPA